MQEKRVKIARNEPISYSGGQFGGENLGSKIHPPIVAVFGKNLAVLELWDLVTLNDVATFQF